MGVTAVVLVLVSACLHAGWNLLAKRQHPTDGFFLMVNVVGMLVLAPAAVFLWPQVQAIPSGVWLKTVIAGAFLTVYYVGLGGAYRSGDMSVAYPLVRSAPVILVPIVTVILGRGEQLGWRFVIGAAGVVAGGFLLPMRRFGDFRLRNYMGVMSVMALVAGLGTVGYTITDDAGVRRLREMSGGVFSASTAALVYGFLEMLFASVWLGCVVFASRRSRRDFADAIKHSKRSAGLAGIALTMGYLLILIAMAFVKDVSYVAAFRQVSIPLGAVLGVIVLREQHSRVKFVGVAMMFMGLMLVATG